MDLEFKDGMCVVTKKKQEGCLVAGAGSIYPNREALFSAEGIKQLSEMYDNSDDYYNEECIINKKKYKRCLRVFNMFFLKRNSFVSRQGIDNLLKAMEHRPVEQELTEDQVDDLIDGLDDNDVKDEAEDVVEEIADEVSEQPEAPGVDEELSALVREREDAELEVLELQENLDKAADSEIADQIKPMLEDAKTRLMNAEAAERDYVNKD